MAKSRSTKVLILASGGSLTTLVSLIIAAILSRLFSQLDYATYRQTLLAYTFAAPFAMLGFQHALFYFLPLEEKRPRGVLVENLLLLAVAGLLVTVFLAVGGNVLLADYFDNPDLANTLLILAPYSLLMIPAASLGACLLARDRAAQVAVFNVGSRLFVLAAVLTVCLIWPQPTTAIGARVSVAFLTTAVALVLMFRACREGDWRPTVTGLRKQIIYSVPLGLATLAGTLSRSLDKMMVAVLCSPEEFAVYVNGAMQIPLVGIITGSIASVIIVDCAHLQRQGRTAEIVGLIHRSMTKCGLLLIPVMVFLLCTAPHLMRFLFSPRYEASAIPFRIYLLLLPMRTLSFGSILMATGNNRHVLIQTLITFLAQAILTWYTIPLFGPKGGAIAAVAATYFVALPYLLVILRRILKCPVYGLFPWGQLLKLGVISAVGALGLLGTMQLVYDCPDVVVLSASGATYATIMAILFWRFGFVNVPAVWSRLRRLGGSNPLNRDRDG